MIPILPYDPARAGLERWFGPRRADILERLWRSPHGLTTRQLANGLAADQDPLCVTTIQCTLERLRTAGLLIRHGEARGLVYRAVCSRETFEAAQLAAITQSLEG